MLNVVLLLLQLTKQGTVMCSLVHKYLENETIFALWPQWRNKQDMIEDIIAHFHLLGKARV